MRSMRSNIAIRISPVRPLSSGMLWRSTPAARRPVCFIESCLPTLGHAVPTGSQWAYEIKHDG